MQLIAHVCTLKAGPILLIFDPSPFPPEYNSASHGIQAQIPPAAVGCLVHRSHASPILPGQKYRANASLLGPGRMMTLLCPESHTFCIHPVLCCAVLYVGSSHGSSPCPARGSSPSGAGELHSHKLGQLSAFPEVTPGKLLPSAHASWLPSRKTRKGTHSSYMHSGQTVNIF